MKMGHYYTKTGGEEAEVQMQGVWEDVCSESDKSEEVVKMGYYYTKSGERRQRYRCKVCGRTFVINPIKPRNYPKDFKEMVVRAVVKEGVGVRQASRIFKLSPP